MITNDEAFDSMLDTIDDEIDCAILNDEKFDKAASELYDIDNPANDEAIDLNTDFSEDIHSPDFVDMDADDMIAAERDIMINPFEEDELLDDVDNMVDEEE